MRVCLLLVAALLFPACTTPTVGRVEPPASDSRKGWVLGSLQVDPVARIGGLLHAMLPLSEINKQKAESQPFMFVDLGVPAMFEALYDLGGQKSQMVVKAVGCGNPIGKNVLFNIGERNYSMLKKLLLEHDIVLAAEDIGGPNNRTIHFDLSTGHTLISRDGKKWEL